MFLVFLSHSSLYAMGAEIAIVFPGDRSTNRTPTPENTRFADLFAAFSAAGVAAHPVVYHDDFRDEVRDQLLRVDCALVWANPIIEEGRSRATLNAVLRDVASRGVFVSAHPDVIDTLGTKEVLYRTRDLGWGCDTHLYDSLAQLKKQLPVRLAHGKARVLKQCRGNGGDGVWKVCLPTETSSADTLASSQQLGPDTPVRVRHAKRGSIEEQIPLGAFYRRCAPYFSDDGLIIDQEYQERLPEGMIRCYLVHDSVVGFGHQQINALYPVLPGQAAHEAPQPGPRLYYPPTETAFQRPKEMLEQEWIPALKQLLGIPTESLPILWDCDFLLGPKQSDGSDSYVLCEINVSSVAPYPESAVAEIVKATKAHIPGHA